MRQKSIEKIFENLKAHLIDSYKGDKELAEILIDIHFDHCTIADRDHYRERRVYMHTGCEPMKVCVCGSIDILDRENLQGLFSHEIGHIIANHLPELFENTLSEEEIIFLENLDDELVADHLISLLFGYEIRYDENKVQWLKLEKQ